jgi:hypothetical protein
MKVFTALWVLIFLLIPMNVHADEIIKDSKILNEHNIKIFVGENNDDSIVLHFRDGVDEKDGVFLLSPNEPQSLKGKRFKGTLLRECGDPGPGVGFYKDGRSGFLIASGEKVKEIIRWYPAKPTKEPLNNSCIGQISPADSAEINYFSSENLSKIIYQVKWEKVYSDSEVRDACKRMAEWNIVELKRGQGETIDSFTEKCINRQWACTDEHYNIVGQFDNICRNIMTSITDCNGKNIKGWRLKDFLGVLMFTDNQEKEIWFLWDAPGYEGDGIYAVEKKDLYEEKKDYEGWVVYNGC